MALSLTYLGSLATSGPTLCIIPLMVRLDIETIHSPINGSRNSLVKAVLLVIH